MTRSPGPDATADPAPAHADDDVTRAVVVIVGTVLGLSLGDALIKGLSAGFGLWQIFVLRSALAVPVLVVAMVVRGAAFRPAVPGWTLLRSLMLVTMWIAYYGSLPHLPLSIAAAAYYTLPLWITLVSAAVAGERVGRVGWLAVAIGFVGVVLILRPDTDALDPYVALPLLSALLYALSMVLTRTRCRPEHPLTLAFALNVAFIVVGGGAIAALRGPATAGGFLAQAWAPMGGTEWVAMALLAASILIGSIGAAIAYQAAPSSIVGTFDFAYVGFAAVWGLVFFHEVPDPVSLAGIAAIVVAGVLALRR